VDVDAKRWSWSWGMSPGNFFKFEITVGYVSFSAISMKEKWFEKGSELPRLGRDLHNE